MIENHFEIIKKLIGEINPVGETNIDDVRYRNIKIWADVAEDMVGELYRVSEDSKNSPEYSRKRISDFAAAHLKIINEISEDAEKRGGGGG